MKLRHLLAGFGIAALMISCGGNSNKISCERSEGENKICHTLEVNQADFALECSHLFSLPEVNITKVASCSGYKASCAISGETDKQKDANGKEFTDLKSTLTEYTMVASDETKAACESESGIGKGEYKAL